MRYSILFEGKEDKSRFGKYATAGLLTGTLGGSLLGGLTNIYTSRKYDRARELVEKMPITNKQKEEALDHISNALDTENERNILLGTAIGSLSGAGLGLYFGALKSLKNKK